MRSTEFINEFKLEESIQDKGIFKAVFLSGLPGAGKSTVISKITDGAVEPRIVNTDKTYEFLLDKNNAEANSVAWELFGPLSKTMNSAMLYNYINSMLPMFVDGTSANTGALLRRSGLLEGIGYDTLMIWVDIDIEESIRRVSLRKRKVDPNFIKSLQSQMSANKQFYKSRFGSNFIEVDNNNDNFSAMEAQTFSAANKFFMSPVLNPVGQKTIKKLQESGEKYLVPSIYDSEYIKKMVGVWYQR